MNNRGIILINFSNSLVSRYINEVTINADLIRLEQENCCKRCNSIKEIKIYEWIKENTYISSDDFNGNFILIFSPFGTLVSVNHVV